MRKEFNFETFLDAQYPVFEEACAELKAGKKLTHWIWCIFPQSKGLGFSELSEVFGIYSAEEAEAYLMHPVLGPRLKRCVELVVKCDRAVDEIFAFPDNLKFRSCCSLFASVSTDAVFRQGLNKP